MELAPLTLEVVCTFLGMPVSDKLEDFRDYEFPRATSSWSLPDSNSIHFCNDSVGPKGIARLKAAGVPLVVASRQRYDASGAEFPTLIYPEPLEGYMALMRALKRRHNPTTIAITGSNGKTTCRELIRLVASTRFKTHFSRGNSNVFGRVGNTIQQMPADSEVYVQETGAVQTGIIEQAAWMLEPDAALITNIGMSHIGEYGGLQENVLADKLSLDKHLKPNGVFFVNYDDPNLRSRKLSHRVISYGITSTDFEYTARNIVEQNGQLTLEVLERQTGTVAEITLNVIGQHNASNAVAAFAVGRWLGLTAEEIANGLAAFRPQGTRQNLLTINGQRVLVDCFNATEQAIVKMAEAVESLAVSPGGKRVLVLADIPRLGDQSESIHRDVGRQLAKHDRIDRIYCYGQNAKWIAEEAVAGGRTAVHAETRSDLDELLRSNIGENDVVAFKGGAPSALALTVDNVFGTEFVYADKYHLETQEVTDENFRYRLIFEFGAELQGLVPGHDPVNVTLGGVVSDYPVVLVGRRSFANQQLETVRVEEPVRTIAARAFEGCDRLVEVSLPCSLRTIGQAAFKGCSALETITLPEGLTTIRTEAFRGCSSLREVVIPASVRTVDAGAFARCRNVVIKVHADSPVVDTMRARLSARQFEVIG